jgi:hypothetical protein
MAGHIRIVRVPPGEAPLWVRERWVGLRLPLLQRTAAPRSYLTTGVVTGPKTLWSSLVAILRGATERIDGYAVSVTAAVEELARHSPEAASWWRTEAPHMFRRGKYFVFHAEAAEVATERETSASA